MLFKKYNGFLINFCSTSLEVWSLYDNKTKHNTTTYPFSKLKISSSQNINCLYFSWLPPSEWEQYRPRLSITELTRRIDVSAPMRTTLRSPKLTSPPWQPTLALKQPVMTSKQLQTRLAPKHPAMTLKPRQTRLAPIPNAQQLATRWRPICPCLGLSSS